MTYIVLKEQLNRNYALFLVLLDQVSFFLFQMSHRSGGGDAPYESGPRDRGLAILETEVGVMTSALKRSNVWSRLDAVVLLQHLNLVFLRKSLFSNYSRHSVNGHLVTRNILLHTFSSALADCCSVNGEKVL